MKKLGADRPKKGKLFAVASILLFTVLLLTQCKDPIGWTAYGTHIEFTSQPTVVTSIGGSFTLSEATAQLTISGLALDSGDNILYFMGSSGTTAPGTLYGTDEAEITATWNAAGFKEFTNIGTVSPYEVAYGFSEADDPVLDIYAVANTTYTIDGGVVVSPWRVSNAATVDLTPSLTLNIPNVPAGTTSIKVTIDNITRTFTSSDYATAGPQTVILPGILSAFGPSKTLSIQTYNSIIPVASAEMLSQSITMGSNEVNSSNVEAILHDIPVHISDSGGFTYTVTVSGETVSMDSVNTFTISSVSAGDLGASLNVLVSRGAINSAQDIIVKDLLLEKFGANEYYTFVFSETIFSLVYDSNGGTGSPPVAQSFSVNETLIVPANNLTRAYSQPNGWNTQPNGEGDSISSGGHSFSESKTLYANWTLYEVTNFNDSGSTQNQYYFSWDIINNPVCAHYIIWGTPDNPLFESSSFSKQIDAGVGNTAIEPPMPSLNYSVKIKWVDIYGHSSEWVNL